MTTYCDEIGVKKCYFIRLRFPTILTIVSIVGSLRDREVACSASDRQGSNFESCVWRTVSSQSSHLAQFSLYVHKGGLKPDSFHFPQCAFAEIRPIFMISVLFERATKLTTSFDVSKKIRNYCSKQLAAPLVFKKNKREKNSIYIMVSPP